MNLEHAQLSMNIFDAAILGVFCLSAVVAFFRGLVREVLSLLAWVGAGVITIYLFPQSTVFLKDHMHVKSEHVAAGAAALGTYFAALITLSLVNSIIIKYVKTGAEVGMIDNLFGLAFGAARGAFIVSLAYLLMSAVVPTDKPPAWLQTSITKPYLQKGAEMLTKIAPRYLSNLEDIVKKQKDGADQRTATGSDLDSQSIKNDADAVKNEANQDIDASKSNTRRALDNVLNAVKPAQEGAR